MRASAVLPLLASAACGAGDISFAPGDVDAPVATAPDAPPEPDAATLPDAAPGDPGDILGSFILTYYYVAAERDYTDTGDDTTIYQPSCEPLATVPTRFADDVVIEGTGQLTDGRVFNYTGSCPCDFSPCFRFEDDQHPWGSGSGNRPLVPFRSIAVDRDILTIGAKYYVLELDGVEMPGPAGFAFVHDGCVSADDTGGQIVGDHIDFFSALRSYYLALDRDLDLGEVTIYEGGARCR